MLDGKKILSFNATSFSGKYIKNIEKSFIPFIKDLYEQKDKVFCISPYKPKHFDFEYKMYLCNQSSSNFIFYIPKFDIFIFLPQYKNSYQFRIKFLVNKGSNHYKFINYFLSKFFDTYSLHREEIADIKTLQKQN